MCCLYQGCFIRKYDLIVRIPLFSTPIPFIPASEKATNNIPHKLEIEYGSTPGQKLDILGTDLPGGKNFIVYVWLLYGLRIVKIIKAFIKVGTVYIVW